MLCGSKTMIQSFVVNLDECEDIRTTCANVGKAEYISAAKSYSNFIRTINNFELREKTV